MTILNYKRDQLKKQTIKKSNLIKNLSFFSKKTAIYKKYFKQNVKNKFFFKKKKPTALLAPFTKRIKKIKKRIKNKYYIKKPLTKKEKKIIKRQKQFKKSQENKLPKTLKITKKFYKKLKKNLSIKKQMKVKFVNFFLHWQKFESKGFFHREYIQQRVENRFWPVKVNVRQFFKKYKKIKFKETQLKLLKSYFEC